jgi:hypothetical protein
MKSLCRIVLITAAAVALLMPAALPVMAEERPGSMEELRDVLKVDKKAFIEKYMELTQAEAKEFWPYYNSYQFDLQKINDRLIKLIDDYAKSYKNLSDQDAVTMINEYLAIEQDQLKQKELYFRTLSKTLPAKKVARYLQLENKINAMVRFELAANIPLVK